MKTYLLLILTLGFLTVSYAQDEKTIKYYKDFNKEKKAKPQKASFIEEWFLHGDTQIVRFYRVVDNKTLNQRKTINNTPVGNCVLTNEINGPTVKFKYGITKCDNCIFFKLGSKEDKNAIHDNITPPMDSSGNNLMVSIVDNIIYPEISRSKNQEGDVIIQFNITENGELEDITLETSGHFFLDIAAVKALAKVRTFMPAKNENGNVESTVQVKVRFRIG